MSDHSSSRGFNADALGLSTSALVLLRDLIVQRTGQFFDDRKLDLLADKIANVVAANGTSSLLDYYYMLKYDKTTDAHWKTLLDYLAVPETYFWRQADQIDALVDVILPAHMQQNPGKQLRIWSAACCTGEEPLSIAMALDRTGAFSRADIQINATDASEAMIERARKGVYGNRSMRVITDDMRDRYFTKEDDRWIVDPRLLARIRWDRVNLAEPTEVARYATADVIYCRNVFIYFSDDAIRDVASTFARHMPASGILFLGASESLLRLSTEFSMIEIGSAFAYSPVQTPAHSQDRVFQAFGRPGFESRAKV